MKKIWNYKSFKGVVSPHEFLQAVTDASSKKFRIGNSSDPSIFLLWLLDSLNKGLRKEKKTKFDVQKLFRGKLKTSIIKGVKDSYEY
jgi:U4/U6.U5 tri-snRNP-associated protein 2